MGSIKDIKKEKSKLKKITEAAFKTLDIDGYVYLERKEHENGVEKPSKDDVEEASKNSIQIVIVSFLKMNSKTQLKKSLI